MLGQTYSISSKSRAASFFHGRHVVVKFTYCVPPKCGHLAIPLGMCEGEQSRGSGQLNILCIECCNCTFDCIQNANLVGKDCSDSSKLQLTQEVDDKHLNLPRNQSEKVFYSIRVSLNEWFVPFCNTLHSREWELETLDPRR